MINPDLQPGKPVQTRSGLEAVIYEVHEGQKYPIIGAYKNSKGDWFPFARRADGYFWKNGGPTDPLDIIPAPKKLTGFINVYAIDVHKTRDNADSVAEGYDRIACLDLAEHNLAEGHGLTEGSSDER